MNKVVRFILPALLAGMVIFSLFMAWPRNYGIPPMNYRPGTQYWQLPGGSRIGYTLATAKGKRKPYPLIYLHGGPAAGVSDLEIKTLSPLSEEGFDVYLYDQAGCGRSARLDKVSQYSADRHRKDLEEIVTTLKVEKVILIAQSWGSILSLLYLSKNPGKVEKIIITAPANIQPADTAHETLPTPDSIRHKNAYASPLYGHMIGNDLRARIMLYAARTWGIKLVADKEADKFMSYMTNELNKMMVCDTANAVAAESTEGFYSHYMTRKSLSVLEDPRPALRRSAVPVRIMKGECDGQPWGYTAEYQSIFRDHRLKIVPGAGHNIFIEQPGPYLQIIREYLRR